MSRVSREEGAPLAKRRCQVVPEPNDGNPGWVEKLDRTTYCLGSQRGQFLKRDFWLLSLWCIIRNCNKETHHARQRHGYRVPLVRQRYMTDAPCLRQRPLGMSAALRSLHPPQLVAFPSDADVIPHTACASIATDNPSGFEAVLAARSRLQGDSRSVVEEFRPSHLDRTLDRCVDAMEVFV